MKVVRMTDKSFEAEVLQTGLPVLVEFWGSWCPPCKMMEPTLDQLAADYEGRLKVGKVNVDQNPRLATQYTIQGAPTFVIFASGQVKGRRTGAQSKGQLERLLKETGVLDPRRLRDRGNEEIRSRLRDLGYRE